MSARGLRSQNGFAVLLLEFGEAELQAQGAKRLGQVAGFCGGAAGSFIRVYLRNSRLICFNQRFHRGIFW
jgi:hypothetical protein